MRLNHLLPLMLCVCQILAWCEASCAQGTDPPPLAEKPATEGGIEEKLQIYYAPDAKGELVPLLGRSLEEIERLVKMGDSNMGPQRPSFSLERLAISGVAGPDFAELTVQASISASSSKWIRVPLRMGGAVLRTPVEYQGAGEHLVEFDETSREYVLWLRGETDQPHQVTMQLMLTLEKVPGQTRLRLVAPRAAYSELVLTVPQENAAAEVPASSVLDSVRQVSGGTEIKVLGLGSDFALSWRKPEVQGPEVPTVLQAVGAVVATIDGRSVRSEATLEVRSFGSEFSTFRIRLPRGATLVPAQPTEYTVRPVSDAGAGPEAEPRLLEVRLKTPTAGPVKVDLITEQAYNVVRADEWLDLGGFEVLGAVRQSGHVAIQVNGDWQVVWGEHKRRVMQVEDIPLARPLDNMVAAFEYFGQPYSLPARIVPRKSFVTVEPKYVVVAGAQTLSLDAKLKYRISGAQVFSLSVDLPGWQVTPGQIGPPDLVDAAGIVLGEGMPLTIPLLRPAKGDVEITIRAQAPLNEGADMLEFVLPRPHVSAPTTSLLVVQPADNVELTPSEKLSTGLSLERSRPDAKLSGYQQDPYYYQAESDESRFAAGFRLHERTVHVDIRSKVTLLGAGGSVEQTLSYVVNHEPVDGLVLDVPHSIIEAGDLEITQAGKPVPLTPMGDDELDSKRPVRMRAALPERRIGAFDLAIRYPLAEGKPIPLASVEVKVPLVMPGEGENRDNRLEIATKEGLKVRNLGTYWTVVRGDAAPDDDGLYLTANTPRAEVLLGVHLQDRRALDATVVERAWIQTWLAETSRIDRAVYRFRTRRNRVSLKLPTGVVSVQIRLDGKPVAASAGARDEFLVPIPPTGTRPRHVLEVHYRLLERGPRYGRLPIPLPEFASAAAVQRTYWQLLLPPDEHLLSGPAGMTPEFRWVFNGLFWDRQPLLEQTALELWSGAPPEGPAYGTNRYLFSSIEPASLPVVRSASRSLLVLAAAGSVLLIGLMLIYLPKLRHPALLFAGAVVTLAASAVYPNGTLLWVQAAIVGAALALLAAFLEGNVRRRRKRAVLLPGASSSIRPRTFPQSMVRAPALPPASTETAAALEVASPGSAS